MSETGTLLLRNGAISGRYLAVQSASVLRMWPGIRDCRLTPTFLNHGLIVDFDPEALAPQDVVLAAEAAVRLARGSAAEDALTDAAEFRAATGDLPSGSCRDLLVGCGSLLLAALGLVLPGIPALPFFVLGCDALCHVYPELRPWFLSIPGVGQAFRASATNESKWSDPDFLGKTLALGLLAAALFLVIHPPLPLVLACELGMMLFSIH